MTDKELSRKRAEAVRKGGKIGGKAKVKKGFALSGKAREAGRKGSSARWKKKNEKK